MAPLSPEAMAIAERHAAEDRDTLARLRREGKVQRSEGDYERRHPEIVDPFVRDIERRAFAQRRNRGLDTIRPRKKPRKRR